MPNANDPVLVWLRDLIQKRGLNTAQLANRTGMSRPHLRRVLGGATPMLVTELMQLSEALDLSMADMGLPDLADSVASVDDAPTQPLGVASPIDQASVDPYGNHVEQLFQVGFGLQCSFMFVADVAQLGASGIPEHVLEPFRASGDLMIQLDALYHKDNNPQFHGEGITLTLSFDGLYDCTFPWTAIRRVFFDIEHDPEGETEPEDAKTSGPHLRLVT